MFEMCKVCEGGGSVKREGRGWRFWLRDPCSNCIEGVVVYRRQECVENTPPPFENQIRRLVYINIRERRKMNDGN